MSIIKLAIACANSSILVWLSATYFLSFLSEISPNFRKVLFTEAHPLFIRTRKYWRDPADYFPARNFSAIQAHTQLLCVSVCKCYAFIHNTRCVSRKYICVVSMCSTYIIYKAKRDYSIRKASPLNRQQPTDIFYPSFFETQRGKHSVIC